MISNWLKLSQAQSYSQYTVKDKDTLSSIAQNMLGDAKKWQEIAKANPQIDPNKIKAGMVINLPNLQKQIAAPQAQISANTEYYIIQTNDTLTGIAEKKLGDVKRWKEIEKLNPKIDSKKMQPGTQIIIPKVVGQVRSESNKQPTFSGDALNALKDEISKKEGGYRSYNRGSSGDTPNPKIDITRLTVGEVMTRQSGSFGKPRDFFAVGKYQFVPTTLASAVADKRTGVKVTDLFSPETQEKLFIHLLYKQPAVMSYLKGKSNNIDAAINGLAAEFASLPTTSGKGKYDGDKAKNKASGGLERVEKIKLILKELRNSGMFK